MTFNDVVEDARQYQVEFVRLDWDRKRTDFVVRGNGRVASMRMVDGHWRVAMGDRLFVGSKAKAANWAVDWVVNG